MSSPGGLEKQLVTAIQQKTSGSGYFFTSRTRKYHKGGRPDRTAADGYWKATGGDIIVRSNGQEVGRKKVLVYYERKSDNNNKGTKTNWIIHEFTIHQMKDVACSSTNAIPDDKTMVFKKNKNNLKPIKQFTNLAATSSYHNHVPALDQLSLHGANLPDQHRSIYDQYQLVHEPVTYMHGEVSIQSNILPSRQPLANIPGDQCNVTQPETETDMQSNDLYRHGDYGDDLDFTTP
ncbi:NAC domain-containing protein 55-like [Olea europaea var. sylvestris]|uniref:NAC domain-containing protein 55-like n=1 Tax=Olea europaea var. sylvestris TaxID=158386 RepID=UPI000C1D6701|nr:NAC domain-containing protein 55-like [Olea europaea var. sylvestris]